MLVPTDDCSAVGAAAATDFGRLGRRIVGLEGLMGGSAGRVSGGMCERLGLGGWGGGREFGTTGLDEGIGGGGSVGGGVE